MTIELENAFNLPSLTDLNKENKSSIEKLDEIDDKIKTVTDLSSSDKEMDDLASKAVNSFDELMSLGMNVEQRFAAPIFDAASKMLGLAVTAKTAKIEKKLRAIDLELKRMRLQSKSDNPPDHVEGEARVIDRNELLRIIKGDQ